MKDRKSHIQSIIKDIVKKKSFPYSKAVTKIKADRKGYYQSKDLKEKKNDTKKSLVKALTVWKDH